MENAADLALTSLKNIADGFSAFIAEIGRVSEADTRVKLIDRILKEVCLWPESN